MRTTEWRRQSRAVTKGKHLEDWRALWEAVVRLPTKRENQGTWDRFARESFELVRAAMLYQRNALAMYEDATLHGLLRPSSGSITITPVPWSDAEPLFPSIMSAPSPMLGGIFVASASFRLPVALLKAVELSADPFEEPETKLLEREAEWKRSVASGYFPGVKKLGCCDKGPLGTNAIGGLRNALVIALVHRDDFGHGEVGQPVTEGTYRREREEVLDSLYVCRILEAQRELCRWVLTRLTEKR